MAIPHAKPGELIDVRPLGAALTERQTTTLVKTPALEVIRLVVPAGRGIATHSAPGAMTLHCVEGRVAFTALGRTLDLTAGCLLFLNAGEPHALHGVEDASLLLTLLLPQKD